MLFSLVTKKFAKISASKRASAVVSAPKTWPHPPPVRTASSWARHASARLAPKKLAKICFTRRANVCHHASIPSTRARTSAASVIISARDVSRSLAMRRNARILSGQRRRAARKRRNKFFTYIQTTRKSLIQKHSCKNKTFSRIFHLSHQNDSTQIDICSSSCTCNSRNNWIS